ncbi:MAG: hypothetical protein KF713_16500 [Turneriella sp.]|nr:hypothetical protein [Turneriella sp.]
MDKFIPPSYIINKIRLDLLLVSVFSVGTFMAHEFLEKIDLPIHIPAFLGTAISLVLAFMINQAYDRWWEARKIWGQSSTTRVPWRYSSCISFRSIMGRAWIPM